MKITYITHACVMIEVNKVRVLTDPWLVGPSWGGSLWHFPTHNFTPKNLPTPDIIYFSHGHDDHFNYETIKKFPKKWFKKLIIAPNFKEKWWKDSLKAKFSKIKYLNHNEIFKFNKELSFQMFLNDKGNIDSSLKLKFKNKTCFFQTDNIMSIKEAKRISKLGKIDIAFMMPYLTGIFPAFYKMKKEEMIKLGEKKKNTSIKYCYDLVKTLKPDYLVPYATDIATLGKNFYANFIHNNNKKDFQKFIKRKNFKTKSLILSPGDYLNFKENDNIKKKISQYKFNTKEFNKFKKKTNSNFFKYQRNEMSLENLEKKPVINSFINKIKNGLKKVNKYNFTVLFLIKYKDQKETSFLVNFRNKKIIENIPKDKLYIPKLIIFTEFYKIANLVKKKYPMNFMTFHNGAITCQRDSKDLSRNEDKFWMWIYNLPF
tara:strand:- start:1451 stop:2737 length:1287 start_codon:yes stop_codon:yes gene_type:complete